MNGDAQILPDGTTTARLALLTVGAGATPDLNDKKLIVAGGSAGSWNAGACTGVTGLIQSGRNGGAWNRSGIVTSLPNMETSTRCR